MTRPRYRYKHTRWLGQVGGDDGYCYAVADRRGRRLDGLTRSEATFYRREWENEIRAQRGEPSLAQEATR
jgi:hypothetical protein